MKPLDRVELILKRKGSQVYSITSHVTVYEALEKMAENSIGALVVIDGTDLIGIMSECDYARKVILDGRSSKEMKVHEIMSSPAVTVNLRTTVDECMQRMTDKRCRHLPVVEGGGGLSGWCRLATSSTGSLRPRTSRSVSLRTTSLVSIQPSPLTCRCRPRYPSVLRRLSRTCGGNSGCSR